MSANKTTVSKPVSKTLLDMKIGDEPAEFDIIQFDSIQTQKTRLQRKFRAKGFRWSTSTIGEVIKVTRVA